MIKELKEAQIDGEQLIIETSNDTEVFDARFLAAALLLQVAKGDGRISEIETASMLHLLEEQYDIHSSESSPG